MNHANALVVFAKQPVPGGAKTRLTPPLTAIQAAELYECFLIDTLALARGLPGTDRLIAYTPADAQPYFASLAPDFGLLAQHGAGLGQRMDAEMDHCLRRGYQNVAIIGADIPTLPTHYLARAFEALSEGAEAVLGPSTDGGYYLIGARKPVPRLVLEVRMSTPTVLADTLALAAKEQLRVELLPPWYDIDASADLVRLAGELAGAPIEVAPCTRAYLARHRIALAPA